MMDPLSRLLVVAAIQTAVIVALLVPASATKLRESEERFRLLDRAPVMVWTARPGTTLDYLNSTCVEFTGRPRTVAE